MEHVKRYTTTGMATDQGKTSNINALGILANSLQNEIPNVGTTTFRMPYTPTSIGAIAGRDIKSLFDPVRRTTRMDSWHQQAGATFEHVGQWMRAWYYPQNGETMEQAVNREVVAARQLLACLMPQPWVRLISVVKMLLSFEPHLHKCVVKAWHWQMPLWLMLKDDGMVMDDGVTTRLGENHFHMTTTTGGAAGVLDWLEEWHQTEWPELDVYMTSVTEQWSVATLSGPLARKILHAAGCDVNLSDEAFPFMSMKDGHVSGIPARIFRISFTGELFL